MQNNDAALCLPKGWTKQEHHEFLQLLSQAELQLKLFGQSITFGLLARFVYVNGALIAALLKKQTN